MFGPLNGVRTVLVAGAAICSIVALIMGRPIVAVVLSVGIAAHAALWWWMYRHHDDPIP
jgi:hypothetical protein